MREFLNQIEPFDFHEFFVAPWGPGSLVGVPILMGVFVGLACGLIGNYLILRRMALVGDAISHSVLPGLAIAYLLVHSLSSWAMFAGAVVAGVSTTIVIEFLHSRSRLKSDAAIGITFCTFFAIGVIIVSVFAGEAHFDTTCVLYGQLTTVASEEPVKVASVELAPMPVVIMGGVALLVAVLILVFYKELLVSSFDPALASSLGFSPRFIHYMLMVVLSVIVVAAFQAVGAILVIAMLILPGAFGQLMSPKFPVVLLWTVFHAVFSAVLGILTARWLDCEMSAAMVVAGTMLLVLAWMFSPYQGLVPRWIWSIRNVEPETESMESGCYQIDDIADYQ